MLTCKKAVELTSSAINPTNSEELLARIARVARLGGTSLTLRGLDRQKLSRFSEVLLEQGFYVHGYGKELDIFWDNAADEANTR